MYFKIKSDVMFRNYNSFGYITDNRNFGYNKSDNTDSHIGDKIVSESGVIFLMALEQKPQALSDIIKKISVKFNNINDDAIMNDAIEFYRILEQDGFIVSGITAHDCETKDVKFSYKNLKSSTIINDDGEKNNKFKKTQDFLSEYFNDEPQLINLHIEITSKCNERCIHCYIPHDNKVNQIDVDLFSNILEQCKEMKLLHLTLTGGEPMLHNNFCEFLEKCKDYNISVNVLSNLTLLNDKIINVMKNNSLLGVQVSLYSMDAEIHDSITQMNGSFELTKNAIIKLKEHDVPLQISCPILKQNFNSYKDVLSWAKIQNFNVISDYLIIASCDNTTRNLKFRLSIDEINGIIKDKIINEPRYLESIISLSEKKKNDTPDNIVCSICDSSICISDNGNVYPCAGWQGYVVGNVNETSLKNIWNNSNKVSYLRSLRKRNFPKCIQCTEKEFCTMCMVRNANEHPYGDPLVVNDFFCDVAKIYKDAIGNIISTGV